MPDDYEVTGSGTNDKVSATLVSMLMYIRSQQANMQQGNHWCSRDHGEKGEGYHYSNKCVYSLVRNPMLTVLRLQGWKLLLQERGQFEVLQQRERLFSVYLAQRRGAQEP